MVKKHEAHLCTALKKGFLEHGWWSYKIPDVPLVKDPKQNKFMRFGLQKPFDMVACPPTGEMIAIEAKFIAGRKALPKSALKEHQYDALVDIAARKPHGYGWVIVGVAAERGRTEIYLLTPDEARDGLHGKFWPTKMLMGILSNLRSGTPIFNPNLLIPRPTPPTLVRAPSTLYQAVFDPDPCALLGKRIHALITDLEGQFGYEYNCVGVAGSGMYVCLLGALMPRLAGTHLTRGFYVLPTKKGHGNKEQIQGKLKEGDRVLLLQAPEWEEWFTPDAGKAVREAIGSSGIINTVEITSGILK